MKIKITVFDKQLKIKKRMPEYFKSKILTVLLILFNSNVSFTQIKEGFDPNEAKELIALCNSFSFLELFNSDTMIIPAGYKKVFTSEVIGLDNMFQVYENNEVGIINFRGSTRNASSWLENLYSAMIPAKGVIKIDSTDCHYKFASDTSAAIHTGYALAVVLLSPKIIEQVNILNAKGISHVLITGHSQGGALALLTRAYLENLPEEKISPDNVFKTYTFGNPMCGNKQFAKEYEACFSENNMSFSFINPEDIVPNLPIHCSNNIEFSNNQGFKKMIYGMAGIDRPILKEVKNKVFESTLISANHIIENLMINSFVSVEVTSYVKDVNYVQIGSVIELKPFTNPNTTVDSTNSKKGNLPFNINPTSIF